MRNDLPSTREALDRLKGLCVSLAIDDFGMGYFSPRALRRSPFDELKIDRSFVSGIGASGEDAQSVLGDLAAGADA